MDEEALSGLRVLVDATRIRIYARLVDAPSDAATLAHGLRLPLPAVNRHLEAMRAAGLVEVPDRATGLFTARPDRVGALGRALAAREQGGERSAATGVDGLELRGAWPHDGEPLADTIARVAPTPDEARVLRAYLVDGRLTTIPAQVGKRRAILRFLLERVFAEDREYPEKEVNQRLALFHPDVASLRRDLVDLGYVTREAGMYRRRSSRPDAAPGTTS
jgi:DNA-binding transcriptional ArsR family regulator